MSAFRIFGVIGLVVLGLVIAPAAGAENYFEAGSYPATVSGAQEGSEGQILSGEGLSIKCNGVSISAEPVQALSELEVAPTYTECTSGGVAATIATEGCLLRLRANSGSVDIVCPEGKTIKVVALFGNCELTIGSQTGLSSGEYANKEEALKTVQTHIKLSGIKYTKTKDGALCPFAGTGEKSDGVLSGFARLKAFAFSGAQTNFFIGALQATKLCEAVPVKKACAVPYAAGSPLEAVNTSNLVFKYEFEKGAETVTCLDSKFEGSTVAGKGAGAETTITAFTFNNCSSSRFAVCSVNTDNRPYRGVFFTSDPEKGNGTMEMLASAAKAHPILRVACNGVNCPYLSGALRGDVAGGTPAFLSEFKAIAATIVPKSDAKCGVNLTFEKAQYKFKEPISGGEPKMWLSN